MGFQTKSVEYKTGAGLKFSLTELPDLEADQILISVKAFGINRADLEQRKGIYPAPKGHPDIPGLEVAGTVEAVGKKAERFRKGDRVMALLSGGGYSFHAIANEALTFKIPDHLNFSEAAALPEALFTVWLNVFELGALKRGESLLIHGGSGGIGLTALKLATLRGCQVFTTSRTDEKAAFCTKNGAILAVNSQKEDFDEKILTHSNGYGVDVILDSIGSAYFDKNLRVLANEGRLVFIDAVSGEQVNLNLGSLFDKNLRIEASTLKPRSLNRKIQLAKNIEREILPYVQSGQFHPHVFRIFSPSQTELSHEILEAGQHTGKLVVNMDCIS